MTKNNFKIIISNFFKSYNFKKKGDTFFLENEDITIMINLQHSNFSNGYYINVAISINELIPSIKRNDHRNGNVRFRFKHNFNIPDKALFDLDEISDSKQEELELILYENYQNFIQTTINLEDLKSLLINHPFLLSLTTHTTKIYFEFAK